MLHGGGPGCHAASDFSAVMSRRPDRRWLWVDLPGYGGSEPVVAASTPRLIAAAQALDGLLERLELEDVDVLAQSLGGTVALRLAALRPERLRRIVVIGSQPVPAPVDAVGLHIDPGLGVRARIKYYGGIGPTQDKMRALISELEWYKANSVPESTVRARYLASISPIALVKPTVSSAVEEPSVDLGAVSAPTLVVWGRHDPFADPRYAAVLADALPRGDLAVLGRTAHHPQAERPEAVAALTEAFFH
ncbi:alpha/beta fold hydrolase [Rhodococcus sp. NPDC056743]|uniref:alpha/beta fold hydrolase n=1 Tax=Rhodococcus sp. NPDC056743 TaxID=3345934 RepID=UPI0036710BDA